MLLVIYKTIHCFILVVFIVFSGMNISQMVYASEQEKTKVNITIESGNQNPDKETENSASDTNYSVKSKGNNSTKFPRMGGLYFYGCSTAGILLVVIAIMIWKNTRYKI